MYNLIQCSDNFPKASRKLWQSYRDEPNDNLTNSESFKSKIKITRNTPNAVKIIVPLKYFSNFWRTVEMPSINCEVNLILTWSSTWIITNSTGAWRFAITETKLYVPVGSLSTQDNAKLLQKLKSGLQRANNQNKYQSDPKTYTQNQYLDHLIDPSFHELNRFFPLSFENENGIIS